MMKHILFLALTIRALTVTPTCWADYQLVKQQLPELYEAAVQTFGEERAQEVFASWEQEDVDYFKLRTLFLYRRTRDAVRAVLHPDELISRYGTTVKGVFGEIDANIYARAMAREEGATFVDETTYRELNSDTRMSDGLVLLVERNRVTILQVIESKVGSSHFAPIQALDDARNKEGRSLGYLLAWKLRGMNIPEGEFTSDQIFLRSTSSSMSAVVPIAEVDGRLIEEATLLVGTEGPPYDFRGSYRMISMSPTSATPIHSFEFSTLTEALITRLISGKAIDGESFAEAERPRSYGGLGRSEYMRRLNAYVLSHGRMPIETVGEEGALLASLVAEKCNQSLAFVFDLSLEAKARLLERERIGRRISLRDNMLRLSPFLADGSSDQRVVSALAAYLLAFESERQRGDGGSVARRVLGVDLGVIREELGRADAQSSIIDDLMRIGTYRTEWREFFSTLAPIVNLHSMGGLCPRSFSRK